MKCGFKFSLIDPKPVICGKCNNLYVEWTNFKEWQEWFEMEEIMNNYQQLASRTLIDGPDKQYSDKEIMLVWNALGLAGEAGEIANAIKKSVFHQHGINKEKLAEELGDVLWYVSAICSKLDINLEDVMQQNIEKLKKRYPNGYSSDDSKRKGELK